MAAKVTCPQGHTQVRNLGSSSVVVEGVFIKINGVDVLLPARQAKRLFYECLMCGTQFNVHREAEHQRSSGEVP